ncbi:hypothetical protein UFOVP611_43 [uncultured Caudovirales phage]|uniref:Uncharacterized protein n=1 Tax=uncultured Caudovirales phage TaxID=2100421 RepID=A0A6J5N2N7_9CAUD|nr:hypothetical protein UFOVP611_43 [uncultured Caudovirales phage]
MVKNYTDAQLLKRVKSLPSFKSIPAGYWLLGVQSDEDAFNVFDDKFYLFHGETFIMVTSGTTNAGKNGLLKYNEYNPEGVAVIKTNEWYYDVWKFGLHRGKMEALKQVRPFLISRDGDKDQQIDEGKSLPVICGINFHANTYNMANEEIKQIIGEWSLGCQVVNNTPKYNKIIEFVKPQKVVTYCLLKEF